MGDSEASIKAAWQALLRGDTAERDRLCDRGETQLHAEARSAAIAKVMAVDFFVNSRGTIYPSRDVFAAGN